MAKVTIKSIAKDLNLSRNTVSMALKGNAKVAPETQRAIITYANSVGYSKLPLPGEADLSSGKPLRVLALRRPDKTVYWDRVINGMTEEASRCNCILNIAVITQDDVDALQLPIGYSDEIDACLFLHKFSPSYNEMVLSDNKVGIFLDREVYTSLQPSLGDVIKSESRRSVMELTMSLIRQGMTKIAFFSPFRVDGEIFTDRYNGYCDAMQYAGLPILSKYVVTSSRHSTIYPEIDETMERFSSDWPEAIVCVNDITALRVSEKLMRMGIRIPEDIAITGFDNDELNSFQPFFTTVDCHATLQGKRMVQQLLWRLEHPDAPLETIIINTEPIYRVSSKKSI